MYMANYQKDYILNDFVTTNQLDISQLCTRKAAYYIYEFSFVHTVQIHVQIHVHKQDQMSSPTNTKGNNSS